MSGPYNYGPIAATAERLLARFGVVCRFTTTPMAGPIVARDAAVLRGKKVSHVAPGSSLEIGDTELIVATIGDPRPGDRIAFPDGEQFVIVSPIEPIKPGDTIVCFTCFGRGG